MFKGCHQGSNPAGGNQHAGIAIQAHRCGPREFKVGIFCLAVDPNCFIFDQLGNGFCYQCFDGTIPPDGICPSPVSCGAGTYQLGNDCVPLGCSGVDANGICSGCNDPLKEVVGGQCVLKTCPDGQKLLSDGNCPPALAANQQVIDGVVHTRPDGCENLGKRVVDGKVVCTECETGYHFDVGVCVPDGRRLQQEGNLQIVA